MLSFFLTAQLAATAYAGLELTTVNPGEWDDLQHRMTGGAYIWVDGPFFWAEGRVSATRWGGHDAKVRGSPFNLEAGRVLELVWAARTGLHVAGCRLGAQFNRRGITWLTDDRKSWGPIRPERTSSPLPRLGYHAEITPYVDCPLPIGPVTLVARGAGPVLIKQGSTLPRSEYVVDPALAFGPVELQARIEFGQDQPFIVDGRLVVYPTADIMLYASYGDKAHPGWGPPVRWFSAGLYVTAGAFRDRQRTVGYY